MKPETRELTNPTSLDLARKMKEIQRNGAEVIEDLQKKMEEVQKNTLDSIEELWKQIAETEGLESDNWYLIAEFIDLGHAYIRKRPEMPAHPFAALVGQSPDEESDDGEEEAKPN